VNLLKKSLRPMDNEENIFCVIYGRSIIKIGTKRDSTMGEGKFKIPLDT